jgi:hypothetical protein
MPKREKPQPLMPRPRRRREWGTEWTLFVLIAIIGVVLFGINFISTHQNQVAVLLHKTPTIPITGTPQPTPTPVLSPTATPRVPHVLGDQPFLGGTAAGFTDAYGQPDTSTSVEDRYVVMIRGQGVQITIDLARGNDGKLHVETVNVAPPQYPQQAWNATTTFSFGSIFLPPDAAHVNDANAGDGVDHHYRSADLAKTFPAADFLDQYGNAVTPGLFIMHCGPSYCQFLLGK